MWRGRHGERIRESKRKSLEVMHEDENINNEQYVGGRGTTSQWLKIDEVKGQKDEQQYKDIVHW